MIARVRPRDAEILSDRGVCRILAGEPDKADADLKATMMKKEGLIRYQIVKTNGGADSAAEETCGVLFWEPHPAEGIFGGSVEKSSPRREVGTGALALAGKAS